MLPTTPLKTASLVEKTGSLKRVVSIPSKKMNGYIFGGTNNHKNTIIYKNI